MNSCEDMKLGSYRGLPYISIEIVYTNSIYTYYMCDAPILHFNIKVSKFTWKYYMSYWFLRNKSGVYHYLTCGDIRGESYKGLL